MKRFFLALVAMGALSATADAGPLRNLVNRFRNRSHTPVVTTIQAVASIPSFLSGVCRR